MSITVRTFNSDEIHAFNSRKYGEFKELFFNSTLSIKEIWKSIDLNDHSATARFIRKQMKSDGLDSWDRGIRIKTGDWL